jgi:hypothetical protein
MGTAYSKIMQQSMPMKVKPSSYHRRSDITGSQNSTSTSHQRVANSDSYLIHRRVQNR